jgi:uncharacterized protein (TIGR03382 family)
VHFADADGDGYGDPEAPIMACDPAEGIVADATDCDDTRSDINPEGTEEVSDGIDQDCSGADLVGKYAGCHYVDGMLIGDDCGVYWKGGCASAGGSAVGALGLGLAALSLVVRRRPRGGGSATAR